MASSLARSGGRPPSLHELASCVQNHVASEGDDVAHQLDLKNRDIDGEHVPKIT